MLTHSPVRVHRLALAQALPSYVKLKPAARIVVVRAGAVQQGVQGPLATLVSRMPPQWQDTVRETFTKEGYAKPHSEPFILELDEDEVRELDIKPLAARKCVAIIIADMRRDIEKRQLAAWRTEVKDVTVIGFCDDMELKLHVTYDEFQVYTRVLTFHYKRQDGSYSPINHWSELKDKGTYYIMASLDPLMELLE